MIVETFLRNEYSKPLVEKRDHSYDLRQLLSEANHIAREHNKFEECGGRQIMLATVPGASEPCHYGCGTEEDPFSIASRVSGASFTEFNPKYRGYYLETIWKTFPFPIGRMRIIYIKERSCLAVSENGPDQFVMALRTEKDVYHLYENHSSWYHIPVDEHLYYIHGTPKRTIYNGSNETVAYLIFDLL